MKRLVPVATSALVRRPASRCLHWRSKPMIEPKARATNTRRPNSTCDTVPSSAVTLRPRWGRRGSSRVQDPERRGRPDGRRVRPSHALGLVAKRARDRCDEAGKNSEHGTTPYIRNASQCDASSPPGAGGGWSKRLLPSSIAEHHPLSRKAKSRSDPDPAAKEAGARSAWAFLYVRGLAPCAVEPKLSRVKSRLDSTGPGHPLGSLDLSG